MIVSADEFVRLREINDQRATHDSAPEKVWIDLLSNHPDMRQWVAHNKTVPLSVLDLLAVDPDPTVRFTVAMKRKASPEILERLAEDRDESVRMRVAYNKSTPSYILARLLRDKSEQIASLASSRLREEKYGKKNNLDKYLFRHVSRKVACLTSGVRSGKAVNPTLAGVSDSTASDREFLKHISRQLVCLGCVHYPTERDDPEGERIFLASGFIVEVQSLCFIVTAGHVLSDIKTLIASRPDRQYRFFLADMFGPNAQNLEPRAFDFSKHFVYHLHHEHAGLDFGLILLSNEDRQLLSINGIEPLQRANWEKQADVVFVGFGMVGFPTQELALDSPGNAVFRPAFITVEWLQAIPEEFGHHGFPMFYGRIIDPPKDLDIAGMSGCPILGFEQQEGGNLGYYVVGLQSGWLPDSGVVFACSMPALGKLLDSSIVEALQNISQGGNETEHD